MVRVITMEELPAFAAEYRRRHGLPAIDPSASPAERFKSLQMALEQQQLRLERISRLLRELRDEEQGTFD